MRRRIIEMNGKRKDAARRTCGKSSRWAPALDAEAVRNSRIAIVHHIIGDYPQETTVGSDIGRCPEVVASRIFGTAGVVGRWQPFAASERI